MRTTDEILATLDNLAESWTTLGHPTQAKVQREALSELRERIAEKPAATKRRR